jgi:Protein of unknown function (DUF1570)
MTISLLLCGVLCLLPGGEDVRDKDVRDTVELKSGKILKGRVLLETKKRIVLAQGSRKRTLQPGKVKEIQSLARSSREVLLEYKNVSDGDSAKLMKLAKKCHKAGLTHESQLFWWKVLFSKPEHEEANLAVGNYKLQGKWVTRGPSGSIPVALIRDAGKAKGKPWQLRSEHAEVLCYGNLVQAVEILLETEYEYLFFFMLFQPDLEFYETLEPFKIAVFKDRKSYPSLAGSVGAYFSPSDKTVYTYFVQGKANALHHEATHAMMYMVTSGSVGSRGSLPGWLHEGLAVYMEGILQSGKGGRLEVEPTRLDKNYIRMIVATASKKLYSVHRVLNFKSGDFGASSYQGLKYAQSYQLFHYMLNGTPDKTREKFMEYFKSAMNGKGQASTFRKLLRKEYSKIETGYLFWGR